MENGFCQECALGWLADPQNDRTCFDAVKKLFESADITPLNGDGKLDVDEWIAYRKSQKSEKSDVEIKYAFYEADKDSTLSINLDEFKEDFQIRNSGNAIEKAKIDTEVKEAKTLVEIEQHLFDDAKAIMEDFKKKLYGPLPGGDKAAKPAYEEAKAALMTKKLALKTVNDKIKAAQKAYDDKLNDEEDK